MNCLAKCVLEHWSRS